MCVITYSAESWTFTTEIERRQTHVKVDDTADCYKLITKVGLPQAITRKAKEALDGLCGRRFTHSRNLKIWHHNRQTTCTIPGDSRRQKSMEGVFWRHRRLKPALWCQPDLWIWYFRYRRCTSNALTDMPACHLHLLRAVDVGQQSKAEPVTAWWVGEAVNSQWWQWGMEWLTDTTVQLIVSNATPVRRLRVLHWLNRCRNRRRWHCYYQHITFVAVNDQFSRHFQSAFLSSCVTQKA